MKSASPPHTPEDVVAYWQTAGPAKWFAKDDVFDEDFRQRFLPDHMAAARRERDAWMKDALGCLALLILLDQFPRNAFRGTAHMFATDPLALMVARHAHDQGFQSQIERELEVFMVLPFEHSESLADQRLAVTQCQHLDERTLAFAKIHLDIIERFGRFPHRNAVLGRATTQAEQDFLDRGGFSG